MESGDDGLESEANVRTRPCLTGAGSPGAQSTATDRGPSRQARLNRSAEGARTAYSARHTCPKTPETQSRNRSVRQAARGDSRIGISLNLWRNVSAAGFRLAFARRAEEPGVGAFREVGGISANNRGVA